MLPVTAPVNTCSIAFTYRHEARYQYGAGMSLHREAGATHGRFEDGATSSSLIGLRQRQGVTVAIRSEARVESVLGVRRVPLMRPRSVARLTSGERLHFTAHATWTGHWSTYAYPGVPGAVVERSGSIMVPV